MNENSGRGYKHINRSAGGDFLCANGYHHVSPPVDKHRKIQLAMVVAGLGFLLPYNCFIFAVDFFQAKYPNTYVMFDMSMMYIISAFFAVIMSNAFVELYSLNTRITFGYAVALFFLIFVAFFEIDMETFSEKSAYNFNLIALAFIAIGCTIQQSSYYGYTSMLPVRYTQAVMTGESAAGAWVSISRIGSKLLCDDEKDGTVIFFVITIFTLILCWILYMFVRKTSFVEFYITLCQESRKKIVLEPAEDAGLIDLEANDALRNQQRKLKLHNSSASTSTLDDSLTAQNTESQFSSLSFANPVYEPTSKGLTSINESTLNVSGPTFKVEDVLIKDQTTRKTPRLAWARFKSSLKARWLIAQQIYPYMVFIALAYFVSMCLYPGILSEIVSCRFGSWMPIILMSIFNIGDFLGKLFSPVVSEWARSKLAAWCSLRLLLLPLMLMCCAPRGAPHAAAAGDMGPIVLSFILGATGGALGAAPMLAAGQRVRNGARELAGNIMTLSYNVGLTAGTLVAYLLKEMLGPPVEHPCGSVYPTIGSVTKAVYTIPVNLTTILETTTDALTSTMSTRNISLLTTSIPVTPAHYTENLTTTIYSTVTNEVSNPISTTSMFFYSIINQLSSTASWSDE